MKVFERLSALSDETIKEITMTYVFGGWDCVPKHVRSSVEDFLHEVFEHRDNRAVVENKYDNYVRGFYRGFEVIADILCRVIKDEDRVPFWYVYEKAARQENRKGFDPINHPDHDLMKESRELGISKEVIRYAGELDIDDANIIAMDDSLPIRAKLYRLNKLLVKSRTYGVITESSIQRDFDNHVRGLIDAMTGIETPPKVVVENIGEDNACASTIPTATPEPINPQPQQEIAPDLPETLNDVAETRNPSPVIKKRLIARMDNATEKYGPLFLSVADHLVRRDALIKEGDHYKISTPSDILFAYIGLAIHKNTIGTGEEKGTKVYWDYFRQRLSMPDIKKDTIQNCLKRIKANSAIPWKSEVDNAIKNYRRTRKA